MKFRFLFVIIAVVGCTKPNPATCCLDSADCAAAGFGGVRECAPGLACVNHECEVPKCSTTGCAAEQPVCNITTDVCEGCATSDDCGRFTSSPTCDTSSGACVECVASADCTTPTKAICDMHVCRACRDDADCESGACGDDGACISDSKVLYLAVGAADAGTCTAAAPCGSVKYALSQATDARNHIVMAKGGYVEAGIQIAANTTMATHLYIHGGDSGLIYPTSGDTAMFFAFLPVTIKDLEFSIPNGQAGAAIQLSAASSELDHVTVRNAQQGIAIEAAVTVRDVLLEDVTKGIVVSSTGTLTLDRGVIRRGSTGIVSTGFGTVRISNLLVWGTTDLALDLSGSNGSVEFTTVADSGTDGGTGPRAVSCANGVLVRSSIIWAPGTTTRVSIDGCSLLNTLAGPTTVAGATNSNPEFVNAPAHDYHIAASSPARDAVDAGPMTDFEGDPRPRGAKFDIGADEAP